MKTNKKGKNMTRTEARKIREKIINLIAKIRNKGKIIAESIIDNYNKYYLLDNTVWYIPRCCTAINNGTLEEFTNKINNKSIKAKFIIYKSEISK